MKVNLYFSAKVNLYFRPFYSSLLFSAFHSKIVSKALRGVPRKETTTERLKIELVEKTEKRNFKFRRLMCPENLPGGGGGVSNTVRNSKKKHS